MANSFFAFKQFSVNQDRSAFKVGTDAVLLGAYADLSGVKSILDIGSGTGVITLMLAQRCSARIVAIEPDTESYLQVLENAGNSRWNDRIKVVCSTLQDFMPEDHFDLIVSNPPYFSDSLKNPDPRKSASRHNDTLTGQALLAGAGRLLREQGRLIVIMPYVEGNILIAEAQEYGLYCKDLLKIRPTASSEIKRLIITFSRFRMKLSEKFLTIEHGKRHEFTEEYINLTRDFYLKF